MKEIERVIADEVEKFNENHKKVLRLEKRIGKMDGRKISSVETNLKKAKAAREAARNQIGRLKNKKRLSGVQQRIDEIVARSKEVVAHDPFFEKGWVMKNKRIRGRLAGR